MLRHGGGLVLAHIPLSDFEVAAAFLRAMGPIAAPPPDARILSFFAVFGLSSALSLAHGGPALPAPIPPVLVPFLVIPFAASLLSVLGVLYCSIVYGERRLEQWTGLRCGGRVAVGVGGGFGGGGSGGCGTSGAGC